MAEIILKIGDCRELMKELDDGSIDLVLTDPPYGLTKKPSLIQRRGGKYGIAKTIHQGIVENPLAVKGIDYNEWIPLVTEKLTENGVLITFCLKRQISDIWRFLENEMKMIVRHIGVWIVKNPPPQARKVKWMNAWLPFIIATKNRGQGHHYNYKEGQHRDVIETSICMGKERTEHPTQKPEKVIEPFIRWWSNKGDWILDPFAGAGTVGKVAQNLGRNCIMFEIDPKWKPIIEKRLGMSNKKLDRWVNEK